MCRRLLLILLTTLSVSSVPAKTFNLVDDLVHTGRGALDQLPKSSSSGDTLVIRSTSGKAVFLTRGSLWDLSLSGYTRIEFAGNARLVCEPGSRLHGTGGVLRFVDEARMIVGKG